MKRKIRRSIASYIIIATIFSAALGYSSSFLPFPTHLYKPFYAFAQTQENAALSLSNLIKQLENGFTTTEEEEDDSEWSDEDRQALSEEIAAEKEVDW